MNDKPVKVEDRRREGLKIDPAALLATLGIKQGEYTISGDAVTLESAAFEKAARYFGIRFPKLADSFRRKGWRWVRK